MKLQFPERFGDEHELEFFSRLKQMIELDLGDIIDPAQAARNVNAHKSIADYFHLLTLPRIFTPNSKHNHVVAMDNTFEDVCCVMEDNGVARAKAFTVFEFFSRINFYERKFKNNGHDN